MIKKHKKYFKPSSLLVQADDINLTPACTAGGIFKALPFDRVIPVIYFITSRKTDEKQRKTNINIKYTKKWGFMPQTVWN